MAKAVSKLSIQVSANTMAVTKGFEKVNRSAKKLRGNLAAGGGGGGLMGGLLGKGGVAGLARMVPLLAAAGAAMMVIRKAAWGSGDAADRIDDLAKQSQKLGMTINALSGLQHAGTQTGVSVNTMSTALQRMVKNVGQASNGFGEAAGTLEKLGLDARELATLAPEETFIKIAKAIDGLGSQYDKVAMAQKIFDSEGVGLVNTFAAGEAGIRRYIQENEELRGITEENAAKFSQFKDATDKLGKAMEGLWQEIGVVLLPVITDLLGILTKVIKSVKDLFGLFGRAPDSARAVKSVEKYAAKVAKVNSQAVKEVKKQQTELFTRMAEPILAQMRPGVGAVTRGTTAGFSAVQRGREAARMAIEQRKQLLREAERQRKLLQDIKTNTAPGNAGVKINQVALAP